MKQNNPQQELAFIKQVMEDSRRIVVEDGHGFIFWGILIVFGLVVTYSSIQLNWSHNLRWFWPGLIALGWVYSIVSGITKEKKKRVKTFAGRVMDVVWISTGISATILGFLGPYTGAYSSIYINPLICVVLGISYAVTGVLLGKKWISALSFGWWAGSVIMFIFPGLYTLLFMSFLMVVLQIVPGIYFYRKSKLELAA